MNNNNVYNDAAFGRYLLENRIVRLGVERFILIWARKFFENRQQWPRLPWFEQLPLYLDALKKKRMQQWQIVQAEQTVHTLRPSFATHLLLNSTDLRKIIEYLGHASVETTRIYIHVVKDRRNPVTSPLDLMDDQSTRQDLRNRNDGK